jgi:NADH-quinone oxidoreductase subunit G
MDGGEALLRCLIDETVADGCIRIAAAHPSTAGLPSLFGSVTIAKVAAPVAATSADMVRA